MKNIAEKEKLMIKFLDEELIDENIHKQWKLKSTFAFQTNEPGVAIFFPCKAVDRLVKAWIEESLGKV